MRGGWLHEVRRWACCGLRRAGGPSPPVLGGRVDLRLGVGREDEALLAVLGVDHGVRVRVRVRVS